MLVGSAQFRLRTDGTGSTIGSPIKLGFDDDAPGDWAQCQWELKYDGPLIRCTINTYYFGAEASAGVDANEFAIRKLAQRYIDTISTALRYRPYTLKELARGKAVIPHIHQGWGDVELGLSTSPNYVVLANCTLESGEIVDDPGLIGTAIRFVFVTTRDSVSPSA